MICQLAGSCRRVAFNGRKEHPIKIISSIPLLFLSVATVSAQGLKADKQSDDWVFLQNDDLRVGLLRSHGGAIAHLSLRDSDFNAFNHYDHGRLVQQSYYGDKDGSQWTEKAWRYNPVQGGSYRGKPAEVAQFQSTEETAYVRTIPRHWATGKLLSECSMEQWVDMKGPVLRVRFRFQYDGKLKHKPRHQETPAVFLAPELSTLVYYKGEHPWENLPLAKRSPGWPNELVKLSENWAAYLNDEGDGVGIYVPNVTEATCYRFQGGSGSNCSYLAPLRNFALEPKLTFSYVAYFTLGDAKTIRKRFANIRENQSW